jgi:hypothetical protein
MVDRKWKHINPPAQYHCEVAVIPDQESGGRAAAGSLHGGLD